MAGTCNNCGAPTWGRYSICPDCRKARKRKGVFYSHRKDNSSNNYRSDKRYVCNSCGYGWKTKKNFGSPSICPNCSSNNIEWYYNTPEGKFDKTMDLVRALVICIILIGGAALFLHYNTVPVTKNSSEGITTAPINENKINEEINSNPVQETISPEQELINFCLSQFSNSGIFDLKKTDYQKDFSSASDWIRNNYENSALTQEQKEQNIDYIVENQLPKQDYPIIITYGSKKDGQITSQGFYYCNEKGVI